MGLGIEIRIESIDGSLRVLPPLGGSRDRPLRLCPDATGLAPGDGGVAEVDGGLGPCLDILVL